MQHSLVHQVLTHLSEKNHTDLIFIVGPTATGKTSLALELAKTQGFNILSADSRQVYKDLEITSGVDLPSQFSLAQEKVGDFHYYEDKDSQIRFFGISLLQPQHEWSIAHFQEYATAVVKYSKAQMKGVIIVGGSGLYHQALFLDTQQTSISPNVNLRAELEQLPIEVLQKKALEIQPEVYTLFNHSDWHNPRRLIRFFEKQQIQSKPSYSSSSASMLSTPEGYTWIGLTTKKDMLRERIKERVLQRIDQGALTEVERLMSRHKPTLPSLSTIGVKEIIGFLNGLYEKEDLIELWTYREFQYAKRQMTWFKKREYISWCDCSAE